MDDQDELRALNDRLRRIHEQRGASSPFIELPESFAETLRGLRRYITEMGELAQEVRQGFADDAEDQAIARPVRRRPTA